MVSETVGNKDVKNLLRGFRLSFLFLTVSFFFLLFAFFVPLGQVILVAFGYGFGNSGFTLQYFVEIITKKSFLEAVIFTFEQAVWTTIFSLLIGLPVGYFIARYRFPGRGVARDLLTLPFILPSVVMLLGLILAFGSEGFITRFSRELFGSPIISLYGTKSGIILAHTLYNISVVVRITEIGWSSLSREEEQVARTLGASHSQFVLRIALPNMKEYIRTAALLVFLYSFNSFAIVLALGEVRYKTIEVLIYESARVRFKFHQAATLTVYQLIINAAVIYGYLSLSPSSTPLSEEWYYEKQTLRDQFNSLRSIVRFGIWSFYVFIVLLASLLPIIAVIRTSILIRADQTDLLSNYRILFSNRYDPLLGLPLGQVIRNTIVIASGVVLLSVALALPIARYFSFYSHVDREPHEKASRLVSMSIILPMATSPVSLSLGLIIAYQFSKFFENNVVFWIITAQTLVALPFVYRLIASRYEQLDPEIIRVARTLGASNRHIFKSIELPFLAKTVIVAAVFSFAISLGEFGATYFFSRIEWTTLAIAVFKLKSARQPGIPSAMAVILILISFISFRAISIGEETELRV